MKLVRSLLLIGVVAVFSAFASIAGAATPQIATNYQQSCLLSDAGTVTCAGNRANSIFGAPTSGVVSSYVPAPAFAGGVTQLASGERHVCAILADTTVQCWGSNNNKQLGQGGVGTADSDTPLTVKENPTGNLSGITQIASQDDTNCARKSNGTAWCWGEGESGQLGDGGTTDLSLATEVFGLTGVVKVVPGSSSTCALLVGGNVKCWGSDAYGQLGNGAGGTSPSPVDVQNLAGAVDIGSGNNLNCALISDGTVKCWGTDADGQMGNGPGNTASDVAAIVPGLGGVKQIAVGYTTVCALRVDATVYCWGYNEDYEAGQSNIADVDSPAIVNGATGALSLGQQWDETACGLYAGGGIKCWGINNYGQAGIDTAAAPIQTPTGIPGVDLVTLAYASGPNTVTSPKKSKLDKKKKTYTVTTQLTSTPNALVNPLEACVGTATASAKYSYKKKQGKKTVKKTKTIKKTRPLTPNGANCVSVAALKLPVKYFNGKKVKVTFAFAGNASLQPISATGSFKLPKVKAKKK